MQARSVLQMPVACISTSTSVGRMGFRTTEVNLTSVPTEDTTNAWVVCAILESRRCRLVFLSLFFLAGEQEHEVDNYWRRVLGRCGLIEGVGRADGDGDGAHQ